MNILLLTENAEDAASIRDELTRVNPDSVLEISSRVDEALELSSVPRRFSAVLLEPVLADGDPLALVRALRSRNVPIAIIGLAEPSDLQWVARVMGAGADDYVIRNKAFLRSLPESLRRACARYDNGLDGRAPSLLNTTSEETGAQIRRSAREVTGAMSFLLRDVPDTVPDASDKVPVSPNPRSLDQEMIKLQGEYSAARAAWETERRTLEEQAVSTASRLRAAEEELSRTQASLQAERSLFGHWRLTLKHRLAAVEQCRSTLEQSVLLEATRQEQVTRQCAEREAEMENVRSELEQERRAAAEDRERLQESLRHWETRLREQAEQHRVQKERWESAQLRMAEESQILRTRVAELEQAMSTTEEKCREALDREQKARLEIQNAETVQQTLTLAIAQHRQEGERWALARNELEGRQKALQDELEASARRHDMLIEAREHYRVKWESANAELEDLRSGLAGVHALAREAADLYQQFLKRLGSLENTSTPSVAVGGAGPLEFPGRAG